MTPIGARFRASGTQRIAVIAVASVLGGTIAAVAVVGSEAIGAGLTQRATTALRDAGITGAAVHVEGREAYLTVEDGTDPDAAERVVADVPGVRWVSIEPAPEPTAEPSPTPTPTPALPPAEVVDELEAAEIAFGPDSTELDADGLRAVARLAVVLARYPDAAVRLTGHVATVTGTSDAAREVALRRAQAVADALADAGIDPARIDVLADPAPDVGRVVRIEFTEAG
ncbi:MAG: OmpA family protein [Microbacteriaceae bacterium]|nr:OmpA family protein [Microbacteriaceae bacterium]